MKIQMAPWYRLKRACPHIRTGTTEETSPWETQTSPSSHSSKKVPRICQQETLRSRVAYTNQVTGHPKQTWTKKLQFSDIFQTFLRPDFVIQLSALVIVELTLKWEERCQNTHAMEKVNRPTHSVQRVWMANLVIRGIPAQPVWTTLSIAGKQHRAAYEYLSLI